MEQTLKVTNVLSDPTRYYIYQYINNRHEEVNVQEVADEFNIHPNVARLHLSKLEDVNMLVSETKKTGKGGRPSRLYRLSEEVIQLHFPYRDYMLLAKVAMQTMLSLGEVGKQALHLTGKRFGAELMDQELAKRAQTGIVMTFEQKIEILRSAATLAGFYPSLEANSEKNKIFFKIFNCPFKEVALDHAEEVCTMHHEFIKGMFEELFDDIELVENENMLSGCKTCSYHAIVAK